MPDIWTFSCQHFERIFRVQEFGATSVFNPVCVSIKFLYSMNFFNTSDLLCKKYLVKVSKYFASLIVCVRMGPQRSVWTISSGEDVPRLFCGKGKWVIFPAAHVSHGNCSESSSKFKPVTDGHLTFRDQLYVLVFISIFRARSIEYNTVSLINNFSDR